MISAAQRNRMCSWLDAALYEIYAAASSPDDWRYAGRESLQIVEGINFAHEKTPLRDSSL